MVVKEDYISGDSKTANQENIIGDFLNNRIVPIGTVIAWAKSITGVPALFDSFLECNGSTISDADSPLNGEDLPNLNSATKTYLRGNTTSGGTGGSATHNHGEQAIVNGGSTPNNLINTVNNEPPYTDVVWVMRVK